MIERKKKMRWIVKTSLARFSALKASVTSVVVFDMPSVDVPGV